MFTFLAVNFQNCIIEHETIISKTLKTETVKNKYFKDYTGEIKSLGAWGGDFVLAAGPINSKNYQNNYDKFVNKWKKYIRKWEVRAFKLKGVKVLPHHKSFSYLINWLKLEEIATLESKPGIAPTLNHLENLLIILRKDPAKFIIRTPFDPKDASNWIHKKTQIKELVLPYTVGGDKQVSDLFSLFDNIINLMLEDK